MGWRVKGEGQDRRNYYISIKTKWPDFYEHFEIPKEVYTYVKMLENHINYPEKSKLKDLYPDRFRRDVPTT